MCLYEYFWDKFFIYSVELPLSPPFLLDSIFTRNWIASHVTYATAERTRSSTIISLTYRFVFRWHVMTGTNSENSSIAPSHAASREHSEYYVYNSVTNYRRRALTRIVCAEGRSAFRYLVNFSRDFTRDKNYIRFAAWNVRISLETSRLQ